MILKEVGYSLSVKDSLMLSDILMNRFELGTCGWK